MPVSKNGRKSGSASTRRRGGSKAALPPLPDIRALESLLQGLGRSAVGNAEAEAQEIMYDAWDATTKARRVALARRALKISPLCADGYVLLAQETARDPDEEIEWYRKGMEAGERALGKAAFKEDAGHFLGILETRPYMRARCGLAVALWRKEKHEDAIAHVRDMLRLNPNDNQGMRYALIWWLMELRRYNEVDDLLRRYKGDGAPQWLYSRALLAFVREGDTADSRKLLAKAVAANSHAPAYLLGLKELPSSSPAYTTMGGENEAQEFARDFGTGWRQTPGALEWLAAQPAGGGGIQGASPR